MHDKNYLWVRLSGEDATVPDEVRADACAEFKGAALTALSAGTSMSALYEALTEVETAVENGWVY